ncbi:TVP38/TMEM64 family protein [Romboutsia sp. 13368]|uniref:TVP38/TMEM64 family protein n=1 Tax=Romboutsia sp. 13368 TaxID=2708053 RepID=UPI0025D0BC2B|nr:VTT domain-containing protein [Romboutsia sp. 13368]
MEYIQNLYYISQDYWILTMLVGLVTCFIESFIPVLPLIGIVTGNAIILGLFKGMIISWIGSSLGTIGLFSLVKIFKNNMHIKKFKNKRVNKIIDWINRQGFKLLFIVYCCPFIPGFLVTIASALSDRHTKSFVPAMLSGKFVMFLVISYPASDIISFIRNPIKIAFFVLLVFLAWKIGNKVNNRLDINE